jgi:uracil-DNA glycosylase
MRVKTNTLEKQLLNLRSDVIDKYEKKQWKEVWFFPHRKKVKGFLGTSDLIIIGLNPSTGAFPNERAKLLYQALTQAGLTNAHLTDLIKVRAKRVDAERLLTNDDFLSEQLKTLTKEIRILRPQLLVAMGQRCFEMLRNRDTASVLLRQSKMTTLPIVQVRHYAYRFGSRRGERRKLVNQLRQVGKLRGLCPAINQMTEQHLRRVAESQGINIRLRVLRLGYNNGTQKMTTELDRMTISDRPAI